MLLQNHLLYWLKLLPVASSWLPETCQCPSLRNGGNRENPVHCICMSGRC